MEKYTFIEIKEIFFKLLRELVSVKSLPSTLNERQAFILLELLKRKTLNITSICNHLNICKSSMTSMIDKLEEKELVKRVKSKENKKNIYIELTEKGEEVAKEIHFMVSSNFNKKLDKLEENEKEDFYKAIQIFKNTIKKIEDSNEK